MSGASREHRQRLLDAQDGLREGVDQLEVRGKGGRERERECAFCMQESRRLALETEQIGGEILGDLRSQRETILRTRHNVRGREGESETFLPSLSFLFLSSQTSVIILSGPDGQSPLW